MSTMSGPNAVPITDPSRRAEVVFNPPPVPKYAHEEMARLGPAVYARVVRPQLPADADGQYVVLDPDTGGFVLAADEGVALREFQSRHPGVVGWIRRVGYIATMRPGGRPGGWRRE